MTTRSTVQALIDEVGQYEGRDGIASVAARGYQGDLPEEMQARLLAEHGTVGDAMHAIRLEAQRRVSAEVQS